jgi:4-carboxymuconolactone decarboxylase
MHNNLLAHGCRILVCLLIMTAPITSFAEQSFHSRPSSPRLAPLAKGAGDAAQQRMLASRPDYNIYKTLAHHVDLYDRWSPLGQFLLNGSSLPPRDREIVMLRMGWLCQSEYEWSQHARIAKGAPGITDAEILNIALGPDAPAWSPFERTLLRMVNELRYEAMISDATWRALSEKYSEQQKIEALFTAAQYQLVSMALNSLGVQLDPELSDRLPTAVPLPPLASMPALSRLSSPRIKPLPEAAWSQEQRDLVAPQKVNGALSNLYATIVHFPKLYAPRLKFGRYLQRESLLPAATRELLILRTAWLTRTDYEWGHHVAAARSAGLTEAEISRIAAGPAAPGWNAEQAAVLLAADELRHEAFIRDPTWSALQRHYDTKQLIEIVYTVGGYTMTALAINSLGIQLEDGYAKLPAKN